MRGAGLGDPLQELEFTTENSQDVEQRVLPTFGVLIARGGRARRLGDFDAAMLVHAEQEVELHRALPVSGVARTSSRVTGIWDKGSGALVVSEASAVDATSGAPLVTTRSSASSVARGGSAASAVRPRRGNRRLGHPTSGLPMRRDRSRPCCTA